MFIKKFLFLLTAVIFCFPLATRAAVNIAGPIAAGELSDVRTITTINNELFFIDNVQQGSNSEKHLYRLNGKKMNNLELLYAVQASLNKDDYVFSFNDDLYLTATGKKGNRIRIYRSQDQGVTWKLLDKIGFFDETIANNIRDVFATDARLYLVIEGTSGVATSSTKLSLWSLEKGSSGWQKQTIAENNPRYVGYNLMDNDPYLYINTWQTIPGDTKSYSAALYTPQDYAGNKFRKISLDNFDGDLPVREVQEAENFQDIMFLRGYITAQRRDGKSINRRSNLRSLRSANGVLWKNAGGKFTKYVLFKDALYAVYQTKNHQPQISKTVDGQALTLTTLGFEDLYAIDNGSLNLHSSADQSLLLADFSEKNVDKYLASEDGANWIELTGKIPDKAQPAQITKAGKYYFFVRGQSDSSFKLYKLSTK